MNKLVVNNDELFSKVVELLRQGRQVTIPVKGSSMLPFIREGKDLVVLEGVGGAEPENAEGLREISRGDIVLFHCGGRYILHRVLDVAGGIALIQGDGVLKAKERCPVHHIYGRAVRVLRGGKKEVDPSSAWQMFLWRLWALLSPFRRYILGLYRRLPGNRA